MDQTQGFVDQSLATCYNYIHTGRCNKAIQMLSVIRKIDSNNPMILRLLDLIHAPCRSEEEPTQVIDFFGQYWEGQSLDGKSIEIFCDQGMGDTINMLRYLDVMKEAWDCKIVLNNYAYYNDFKELLEQIPAIHKFTNEHIKCDYNTNILSIPALLNGLKHAVYYPVHFLNLLDQSDIPTQSELVPMKEVNHTLGKPSVGISWKSNSENVLSQKKSVPDDQHEDFLDWCDDSGVYLYGIHPDAMWHPLKNLSDTASAIAEMDVIVSVDTVVLHLAGAMGKPTFGLLPFEADPRWSKCGNSEVIYDFGETKKYETSLWYPSVRMFRQEKEGDWSYPLNRIKEELASLCEMK